MCGCGKNKTVTIDAKPQVKPSDVNHNAVPEVKDVTGYHITKSSK